MSDEERRKQAAEACGRVLDTEFFKALCEPVRVAIIRRLILIGRSDVAAIAEGMPQDRSVVSRHLALLERAGIAVSEKEGRHVFYDLDGPAIVRRLEELLAVTRGLADICCPPAKAEAAPSQEE
ncbi:MAG: ArsR/SmtB family transcription factor [Methyloligellaceae bacterium]